MCWQWTWWVIYRLPLNYIMTGLNLFYKTIRPYLITFHNSFFITRIRKRHWSLFKFQKCDLWKALVYNSSWHHGLTHESLIFFTFKFGRSKGPFQTVHLDSWQWQYLFIGLWIWTNLIRWHCDLLKTKDFLIVIEIKKNYRKGRKRRTSEKLWNGALVTRQFSDIWLNCPTSRWHFYDM